MVRGDVVDTSACCLWITTFLGERKVNKRGVLSTGYPQLWINLWIKGFTWNRSVPIAHPIGTTSLGEATLTRTPPSSSKSSDEVQ